MFDEKGTRNDDDEEEGIMGWYCIAINDDLRDYRGEDEDDDSENRNGGGILMEVQDGLSEEISDDQSAAAGKPCLTALSLSPMFTKEDPQFLQYVLYQGFSNPHLAQFDFTLLRTFFESTLFFPRAIEAFRRFFFAFFSTFASKPNRANNALCAVSSDFERSLAFMTGYLSTANFF